MSRRQQQETAKAAAATAAAVTETAAATKETKKIKRTKPEAIIIKPVDGQTYVDISSRVRRKANLEVTCEEKPKTRLRRRKANKRLCREQRPVCAYPDEEKPVSLVSHKKASLHGPRVKNYNKRHFARKKKTEIS